MHPPPPPATALISTGTEIQWPEPLVRSLSPTFCMVRRPYINPASPEALGPKPFRGGRLQVLSLQPRWKLGSRSALLDSSNTVKMTVSRPN